jgi:hypothetical protein
MKTGPLTTTQMTPEEREMAAENIEFYPEDIARLVKVAATANIQNVTPLQLAHAWQQHSTDWSAGWLEMPTSDDEIAYHLGCWIGVTA